MTDSLDIAQVAKLTGLTSRALRFYEARDLVRPLRTASGRRHYGPAELERLHHILALKRAGLSLAQIQRLVAGRQLDLRGLVTAQIEALDAQASEIEQARTLLTAILSRIDRSEPIDVATFCSLIRQGDMIMTQEKWETVRARYMTDEQLDEIKTLGERLPSDFDQAAHYAKWQNLSERIKAALPMDPASPQAQAFLDEWQALIDPWLNAVSANGREGFRNLYAHFDEWQGEVDSGLPPDVFHFHQDAARARGRLKWIEVQKRYMTPEQFDAVAQARTNMPADFDQQANDAKFHALLQRIKDALPMDAASPKAQAFHDEWQALIQPFLDAASPAAREGLRNFYAHVEDWYQEIGPGFIIEAFRFHRETERARAAMKT
jgi:DNA-binding transcriptional MerR regulator